jgi:hypothetical protein
MIVLFIGRSLRPNVHSSKQARDVTFATREPKREMQLGGGLRCLKWLTLFAVGQTLHEG